MEKHRQLTLTALRQRAGMTQMELALALDVSQTSVSHWEQEQPIPQLKASAILAVLRAKDRTAVPAGIGSGDLARPWDVVLLEIAKPAKPRKRPRLRAPAGRAARRAVA